MGGEWGGVEFGDCGLVVVFAAHVWEARVDGGAGAGEEVVRV